MRLQFGGTNGRIMNSWGLMWHIAALSIYLGCIIEKELFNNLTYPRQGQELVSKPEGIWTTESISWSWYTLPQWILAFSFSLKRMYMYIWELQKAINIQKVSCIEPFDGEKIAKTDSKINMQNEKFLLFL